MSLVHSFGVILLAIVYVHIYIYMYNNYTYRLWCRKMQHSSNLYVTWMLCSLLDIIQHIILITNVHNLKSGKVITFRDFLEIWPLAQCWKHIRQGRCEQNRFHGWKTPTRCHGSIPNGMISMIWADIQYHIQYPWNPDISSM